VVVVDVSSVDTMLRRRVIEPVASVAGAAGVTASPRWLAISCVRGVWRRPPRLVAKFAVRPSPTSSPSWKAATDDQPSRRPARR
jgi:hypothetical protein